MSADAGVKVPAGVLVIPVFCPGLENIDRAGVLGAPFIPASGVFLPLGAALPVNIASIKFIPELLFGGFQPKRLPFL